MLKRMMEDLASLDSRLAAASVGTGQIVYLRDISRDDGEAAPVQTVNLQQAAAASHILAIKPGDLLYAVIDTGVNSDVPSAVMATVASGKYKNARLLGGFQRHDERLVLAFTRAVLPTGETVQLEAYAVDPSTTEASVASRVDTHFFSRWLGLVASTFLEGLGNAKRYSGSQSTIYGTNNGDTTDQMVWNTYSMADQAWIAAGKVGEKAGKIFERNFERPPTVYLESGTPVGILVLGVKGG
jgi:type IV secretory pathway VirB10-like protein